MSEEEVNQNPEQLDEPYVEPAVAEPVQETAAEAPATNEQPKWQRILNLVATILITAAGLFASLFMCLMSVGNYVTYEGHTETKSMMLVDVFKSFRKLIVSMGNSGRAIGSIMSNAYLILAMVMGIVCGITFGIILIVKTIQHFAAKKQTNLEKKAITSSLFFFAISLLVLSLVGSVFKEPGATEGTTYGTATLAGLIIVGILFGAYFVLKVVANIKTYFANKNATINFFMNLAWAVLAVIILALLSCVPVVLSGGGYTYGMNFMSVFADTISSMSGSSSNVQKQTIRLMISLYGLAIQIWFIFQAGKGLHKAMSGTVSSEKPVALGPQIWRLIFSVLYLVACVVLMNDYKGYSGMKPNVAVPVVILVFAVAQLVICIVNKCIVKTPEKKVDTSI